MPSTADKKPVRLDFPPADRERLRIAAAVAGVPMSTFAREAVLARIEKTLKRDIKDR
jgi:hypothetical protein